MVLFMQQEEQIVFPIPFLGPSEQVFHDGGKEAATEQATELLSPPSSPVAW